MENNEPINKLIDGALNSLDGAVRATPKPYLFTRLNARMQNERESNWDRAFKLISKPAVAFTVLCLVIAVNTMVVALNYTDKATAVPEEQFVSVDEYNSSAAYLTDTENIEP
jgi:hypothetical protein